jgi:hypothetical protein
MSFHGNFETSFGGSFLGSYQRSKNEEERGKEGLSEQVGGLDAGTRRRGEGRTADKTRMTKLALSDRGRGGQ